MNALAKPRPVPSRPSPPSSQIQFSPYRVFSREEWAKLRADTPMTLVPRDLEQLSGLIEELSMAEVEQIYLPLSRLLNLHVAAAQELHAVTSRFLGRRDGACPTFWASPARWPSARAPPPACCARCWRAGPTTRASTLITTDGFLHPNAELERRGLMDRKGFPESFDTARLLNFLHEVKSGKENVEAPVYSHFQYDIIPGQTTVVDRPGHSHRRRPQRAAAGAPAQGRRGHSLRLGLLQLLDLHRCRCQGDRGLVRHAFLAPAPDRFPRSCRLLPSLCAAHTRCGARPGARDLAHDQREESEREHTANPPARPPDLRKGANHRIETVALRRI